MSKELILKVLKDNNINGDFDIRKTRKGDGYFIYNKDLKTGQTTYKIHGLFISKDWGEEDIQ